LFRDTHYKIIDRYTLFDIQDINLPSALENMSLVFGEVVKLTSTMKYPIVAALVSSIVDVNSVVPSPNRIVGEECQRKYNTTSYFGLDYQDCSSGYFMDSTSYIIVRSTILLSNFEQRIGSFGPYLMFKI